MTITKEQLSELLEISNRVIDLQYGSPEHIKAMNDLHDKTDPSVIINLIDNFLGLQEALQNIAEPDYNDIDGMIITDMGLKHFTEKTAEFALEKYGAK